MARSPVCAIDSEREARNSYCIHVETPFDQMQRLAGAPASPGIARGPAVHVAPSELPSGGRIADGMEDAELERLSGASATASDALLTIAAGIGQAHAAEASIFEAQAAMARDPALHQLAESRIRAGNDAVAAIQGAGDELAAQLESLDDETLAARAADVRDVAARIVVELEPDLASAPQLDRAAVIVADDLAPSLTASLPRDMLLGIALESGSPTAHAAILARAYGIPAVVGVPGLLDAVGSAGEAVEVALDGTSGEVIVAPDEAAVREFERRAEVAQQAVAAALADAELPAVTTDGTPIQLLANIGSPAEAATARQLGARGVGLFRTEFLFVGRAAPPTEDEQVEVYRQVVDAFAPEPVIIRLLDVGGDKPIPYIRIPPEANPFLGVRALRLADERPDIFVRQLRAAMRAAAGAGSGAVKVMAPMVADGADVALFGRLAGRAREELAAEGIPHDEVKLGVMLETPSAVLVGRSYFDQVDFASLGTNDLAQYTLAADRGNRRLARYHDALHPALLHLVTTAVSASDEAGIELSVCGEMASDPASALALVGLGIRRLSMVASSLAAVRRAIRRRSLAELRGTAAAALRVGTAEEARRLFDDLLAGGGARTVAPDNG